MISSAFMSVIILERWRIKSYQVKKNNEVHVHIYICIQLKRQMLTLVHVLWTPVDRFLYCCQVCEFCTVLISFASAS